MDPTTASPPQRPDDPTPDDPVPLGAGQAAKQLALSAAWLLTVLVVLAVLVTDPPNLDEVPTRALGMWVAVVPAASAAVMLVIAQGTHELARHDSARRDAFKPCRRALLRLAQVSALSAVVGLGLEVVLSLSARSAPRMSVVDVLAAVAAFVVGVMASQDAGPARSTELARLEAAEKRLAGRLDNLPQVWARRRWPVVAVNALTPPVVATAVLLAGQSAEGRTLSDTPFGHVAAYVVTSVGVTLATFVISTSTLISGTRAERWTYRSMTVAAYVAGSIAVLTATAESSEGRASITGAIVLVALLGWQLAQRPSRHATDRHPRTAGSDWALASATTIHAVRQLERSRHRVASRHKLLLRTR